MAIKVDERGRCLPIQYLLAPVITRQQPISCKCRINLAVCVAMMACGMMKKTRATDRPELKTTGEGVDAV
jgi:hypothetical protein